jgi:hypothetical protein
MYAMTSDCPTIAQATTSFALCIPI